MSFETVDIERHLLKVITTDKMRARAYILSIKDIWFTGLRNLIYKIVFEIFNNTPTMLTTELFEAEISKRFSGDDKASKRSKYLTEWTIIQNIIVHESVDALIDKLKEKERINKISDICAKTLQNIQNGDVEQASAILKAESMLLDSGINVDKPLIDLTDVDDLHKHIEDQKANPSKYSGIKTGFKRFDIRTGGLFKAELTLIAALTGIGKSTILKQMAFNIARGNLHDENPLRRYSGKNVLHVTNEEHRDQVRYKYSSLFSDIDYFQFKNATISDDDLIHWRSVMTEMKKDQYGRIFVKEIPQFSNASEIYRCCIELENRGFHIDVVVLDYLDHLSPIQKAWSEYDEQAKAAWDVKSLAIDLNIPLITATQAGSNVEDKQEKGRKFGKNDVYGSRRKIHIANTFIGIMLADYDCNQLLSKGGDREDESACDKFLVAEVCKSRDGAIFSFALRHKVKVGRVEDDDWMKNKNSGPSDKQKVIDGLNEMGKVISEENKGENNSKSNENSDNVVVKQEKNDIGPIVVNIPNAEELKKDASVVNNKDNFMENFNSVMEKIKKSR